MSKKISQLTAVVTPAGSDQLEVNQSGTSKRITITQLNSIEATARAAADTTLNLAIGTEATARASADSALQTDINNRIKKDGSVTFTASQPMGGFKLTGLAAGSGAGDSVRYEQAILTSGANAFGANQPMGGFKLTGLSAGSSPGDSVRYEQVLLLAGGTMSGAIAMGTNKITGLGDPSSAQDGVTLSYMKTKGNWDLSSNRGTKAINTSTTLTPGTDNQVIFFTGDTVNSNRVITLANPGTGLDGNFRLVFPMFTVTSGNTLTVKRNLITLRIFEEGTYNPLILDCYDGTSAIEQPYFNPTDPIGVTSYPTPLELKIFTGYYNFYNFGGAISTINVKDFNFGANSLLLPAGSIILRNQVVIEVETPFTSGGAATIAWGYTGTTNAFDAATGFGSAPYTGANLVDAGSVTTPVKLTSASNVTITIAGADLTDGSAYIHIPVLIHKF